MPRTVEIQLPRTVENFSSDLLGLDYITKQNENIPRYCFVFVRINQSKHELYIHMGRVLLGKYLFISSEISISLRMFDSHENVLIKIPGVPGRIYAKKH